MSEFYNYMMGARVFNEMGMGPGQVPDSVSSKLVDRALKEISDWAIRKGAKNPDEASGMLKAAAHIAQAVNSPLFMSLFHDHPMPTGAGYNKFGYKAGQNQTGGTGI